MTRFVVFVLLLFSILACSVTAADWDMKDPVHKKRYDEQIKKLHDDSVVGDDGATREEIIKKRENRKRQLQNLVNHMRKQLAAHSAGEKILDPEEKASIEKRIDMYLQKINSYKEDMDERDIERLLLREERLKERRQNRKKIIHQEL